MRPCGGLPRSLAVNTARHKGEFAQARIRAPATGNEGNVQFIVEILAAKNCRRRAAIDAGLMVAMLSWMAAAPKMNPNAPPGIPPLLHAASPPRKERAPTLYAIIVVKLIKAVFLLLFAFAVFSLRNSNLQEELSRVLAEANLAVEGSAAATAAEVLRNVSSGTIELFAAGSFLYGAFSLVEGAGLMFRAAWAGWMVIAESAIFIPLEIWEAVLHFSLTALLILVLNVGIVWYLYANRYRLFYKAGRGDELRCGA